MMWLMASFGIKFRENQRILDPALSLYSVLGQRQITFHQTVEEKTITTHENKSKGTMRTKDDYFLGANIKVFRLKPASKTSSKIIDF